MWLWQYAGDEFGKALSCPKGRCPAHAREADRFLVYKRQTDSNPVFGLGDGFQRTPQSRLCPDRRLFIQWKVTH
jgi:hypothetical protein